MSDYEKAKKRADAIGVPVIEPIKPMKGPPGNPIVAVCGECGRDVHLIEGYSCSRVNCPTQAVFS